MPKINTQLIEKYQSLYRSNPDSTVFATLAEVYRKLGLLQQAKKIAESGVAKHPHYAGGRAALGKILYDLGEYAGAARALEKTIHLSPDNVLAQQFLAQCYLRLKQPKQALKAYKMIMLLHPQNEEARKAVQKLESLTADEYDTELFQFKNVPPTPVTPNAEELNPKLRARQLERIISLADAFIIRSDIERAEQVLRDGQKGLGPHPEITRRLELLVAKQRDAQPVEVQKLRPVSRRKLILEVQQKRLQKILLQIHDRKKLLES